MMCSLCTFSLSSEWFVKGTLTDIKKTVFQKLLLM